MSGFEDEFECDEGEGRNDDDDVSDDDGVSDDENDTITLRIVRVTVSAAIMNTRFVARMPDIRILLRLRILTHSSRSRVVTT